MVLFGLIAQEEKIQTNHVVWWLFATWSAVEVIRYSIINYSLYILTVLDPVVMSYIWRIFFQYPEFCASLTVYDHLVCRKKLKEFHVWNSYYLK